MRTIAVYNIKGGTGKTSTAVNLAYLAALDGARTLLWDLDPQGASTYLFRVRPKVKGGAAGLVRDVGRAGRSVRGTDFDRLDLLPADFTYRNLDLVFDRAKRSRGRIAGILEPLRDDYDAVFLDCPPGASLLSENVLRAAATVLVPLIPTTLSLRTFDQLTGFVADAGARPTVAAFFSMVDRRKRLHREIVEQLPLQRPEILPIGVPASATVERMAVERAPVPAFAPRHDVVRAYRLLWQAVASVQAG